MTRERRLSVTLHQMWRGEGPTMKMIVLLFALLTNTSTGVLTVKLVPATTVRVTFAATAPKAETLPNARVALFVPRPRTVRLQPRSN